MTLPAWLFVFAPSDDPELGDRSPAAHQDAKAGRALLATIPRKDTTIIATLRGNSDTDARSALERIYRDHAKALASFANSFVHSPADARDIVADVFTAIWAHRTTFAPSTSIAAYLYTAVRRRALNVVRDSGRRARHHDALANTLAHTPSPSSSSETTAINQADLALEAREAMDAVRAALQQLSPDRRRIMRLRWQDGLSNPEIAATLGLSEKTVRNQLSLGLAQLRRALGDLFRD